MRAQTWATVLLAVLLVAIAPPARAESPAAETLFTTAPLKAGHGTIDVTADGEADFVVIGDHRFLPDRYFAAGDPQTILAVKNGPPQVVAPFQRLAVQRVTLSNGGNAKRIGVAKRTTGDPFWDQVIVATPAVMRPPITFQLVETGEPLAALPAAWRNTDFSAERMYAEQRSAVDPQLQRGMRGQLPWDSLAAFALPLDFQKLLVASPHDSAPAFAYANGQWFTTVLSRDLPKWSKEDRWFAPGLFVDDKIVRPAPLSAQVTLVPLDDGRTSPACAIEWRYGGVQVRQELFSLPSRAGAPEVHARFRVTNFPAKAKLALGVGRRPNAHWWDDTSRPRTPAPFISLRPRYRQQERFLVDAWGRVVLEAGEDFRLEPLGPLESLLVFNLDRSGEIHVRTPQTDHDASEFDETLPPRNQSYAAAEFAAAKRQFQADWGAELRRGAQVRLPDPEWTMRIDAWLGQVAAITRVHYEGQERLSYGAYFYQYFFGPEEGWPIVALAQWGRSDEAQRQADIMLSAENRDKQHVHHQSRNGTFAWYAAETARLTDDRRWLAAAAPALRENAQWTIDACKSTEGSNPAEVRGLLPPHIYGGDVRDPATSLYASMVCWKGLTETAAVFRDLGGDDLQEPAQIYEAAAQKLRGNIDAAIAATAVRDADPPFLPLALALPSLGGKHEGPYDRLTQSRLGNYWTLFACSVLELEYVCESQPEAPNRWLLDTLEKHGGLWAGLPRFYDGLDAAYSLGVIRTLVAASARRPAERDRAINALHCFFLHAASRNGAAIPEVAGLFPERTDRAAYLRVVRDAPWSFGMYDPQKYLEGRILFTEPLGAVAGAGLWMIRSALVLETRNERGELDGRIHLLAAVPDAWYEQGKEIELRGFPTYYGLVDLYVASDVNRSGQIRIRTGFRPNSVGGLREIVVRLAPPGKPLRDVTLQPRAEQTVAVTFER